MCRHICNFYDRHSSALSDTHRAGKFSARPRATTLKSLISTQFSESGRVSIRVLNYVNKTSIHSNKQFNEHERKDE